MTREEIEAKLVHAMVEELHMEDVRAEDIDVNAPLFAADGVGLDSLDAVELVVVVEKHFGLSIGDADEAKAAFTTVRGLAEYILARTA